MKNLIYILFLFGSLCYSQNPNPALISVSLGNIVDDGLTPVLSNFNILTANDTIHFNSSKSIAGLTSTGFIVSGKTISSININGTSTTGHYFITSTDFDFWDNNTIRLESGDGEVYDFTMEYIVNRISEPTATDHTFYVDGSVSSSGDGSSELQAFKTITEGMTAVNNEASSEGSTVWIKAYDYGDAPFVVGSNGTIDKPIKIIGYETSTGGVPDLIDSNYFNYSVGLNFDSTKMPLIKETIIGTNSGMSISSKSNIIIKNLQFSSYYHNLLISNGSNVLVENCNSELATHGSDSGGNFDSHDRDNINIRFKDCIGVNGDMASFRVYGDYNLIENCQAYADLEVSYSSDYYFRLNGSNNIIRNSHCSKVQPTISIGKGYSVKGSDNVVDEFCKYNLVEKCTAENMTIPLQVSHSDSEYNVFKDCDITGINDGKSNGVIGLFCTANNIFERITSDNYNGAVLYIGETTEDNAYAYGSHDNIIRNSIFKSGGAIVRVTTGTRESFNNKLINCTFDDHYYLEYNSELMNGINNEFINCIIQGAGHSLYTAQWEFSYTNTWDSWLSNGTSVSGTNNISVTPNFVDTTYFVPQNLLLNAGLIITGVEYDKNGKERSKLTTTGNKLTIGAVEIDK